MPGISQFLANISQFFISNRPVSVLLLATLIILGAVAFLITPKQYNPEITRPAFAVSLAYEGATVDQAVGRVVYELTEKIGAVPGVEDIYTTVHDGAQIDTTVIFTVGYDATKAKLDLLTQLDQHSYRVRGFISPPQVQEINPETVPVLQIVFTDPSQSIASTRAMVQSLRGDLVAVPGVSEVGVVGGYEPGLVVEAEPVRLQQTGITLQQLEQALGDSQVRDVLPGTHQAERRVEQVVDSPFGTPEQMLHIPLGKGYVLGDVATVYEGTSGARSYVYHAANDEPMREAIMLSVAKVEGTNAPTVTATVREVLAERVAVLSSDTIEYTIVADQGELASREIIGLAGNLVVSVGIVAAVLFLFLSARAAVIVLVTIPLTFLVVFGLGYVFDQTINRITLFALILSLGLLVDAAIVVTESIYTRMSQQRDAEQIPDGQVSQAVEVVAVGLLLSLVTSVIVFLPMHYITGMMGPYMGPIAFFVPTALMVSFLVAIIIIPFLASRILRPETRPTGPSRLVQRGLGWVTERYERFLNHVLADRRRQKWFVRGAFGLLAVSLLLPATALVHFQMLPGADREQLYAYVDLPVDFSVPQTAASSADITAVLLQHPEVVSVQSFVARAPIVDFNGLFKGAQDRTRPWQSTHRINLSATADRTIDSETITRELRTMVVNDLPETAPYLRLLEEPPGPPVRATLEGRIYGVDETARNDLATALLEQVSGLSGVVDPYVVRDTAMSRVVYTPEPAILREQGIAMADVQHALQYISQPQAVGEYLRSDANEYSPLLLSVGGRSTDVAYTSLPPLMFTSASGEAVPLASLVRETHELRSPQRTFESSQVFTAVTAEVADRPVIYVVLELITHLLQQGIGEYSVTAWGPFGMTLTNPDGNEMEIVWGGEWEMTLENFRDLGVAMGIAILLVYAVLVGRYRSFSTPALILLTVPLGLIGILWGFLLLDQGFGIYLTATALIGFIALIGIVVNNAIIYLEYVEQAVGRGLGWPDALVEAGTHRLRPILLTSLTTVLGSLTIAFDPVWSGLAWAIVFGLSTSTLLTLVMYPILLVYFQRPEGVRPDK